MNCKKRREARQLQYTVQVCRNLEEEINRSTCAHILYSTVFAYSGQSIAIRMDLLFFALHAVLCQVVISFMSEARPASAVCSHDMTV